MNDELNEEIQELKKELQEYSNELDKVYSSDDTNSQKTMKIIEKINKDQKKLEQKVITLEKDGKNKDTDIFLNEKYINWLKEEDEILKLCNE